VPPVSFRGAVAWEMKDQSPSVRVSSLHACIKDGHVHAQEGRLTMLVAWATRVQHMSFIASICVHASKGDTHISEPQD